VLPAEAMRASCLRATTRVATEARGWRSTIRRSIARLVTQPGQNMSSHGVPAISAARIVGDHSVSRLPASCSFQRSTTAFASARSTFPLEGVTTASRPPRVRQRTSIEPRRAARFLSLIQSAERSYLYGARSRFRNGALKPDLAGVPETISALRETARRNCCLRASRARRPARPLRHECDGRRPSVPPPWRSRR
jgi:hypothetical protein